jgi:hypothetical protein
MTHEYVVAVGGRVEPCPAGSTVAVCTAIAWAADRVLAVGADDTVRSISRGDSTFLDLGGCIVTPLPGDPARADALVRAATRQAGAGIEVVALLIEAALLPGDAVLEPGSPADLAFWRSGGEEPTRGAVGLGVPGPLGLVATVRAGAFSDGDEHRGPFPPAD